MKSFTPKPLLSIKASELKEAVVVPHISINILIRGMKMMETIIYDIEKGKVVFLNAQYYEGNIDITKLIRHFDDQYQNFFNQ
jgi:hypothetical protein